MRPYQANPRYVPSSGQVDIGWDALVNDVPGQPAVLALDGPAFLDWENAVTGLTEALADRGFSVATLDIRTRFARWDEIVRITASAELPDDPHFATLASGSIRDLFTSLQVRRPAAVSMLLVYGPGAALVNPDVLWYADLPKRYAEAAITAGRGRNLGQPEGTGPATTKRLFYVDWPLLDRHRDGIAARIDRLIDTQEPARPTSLSGPTLRATAKALAHQPFRTRPTFNTTSWGGHWGQHELGFNPEARNTALGYELIAPESGLLIGTGPQAQIEMPFQLLVALQAEEVLGRHVFDTFGASFPIRFDYLDTVGGGNLSVHCHPQDDYMKKVFGWPYTQHETYYMMVGGAERKVYLGLQSGVNIEEFRRCADEAADNGTPFDIERFVNTFPAQQHQLFLIPAGTPHGSGEGNVVLEVSATPYLYSLRFYDWLRRDAEGRQRPVHVEHAFRNLSTTRTGQDVQSGLVQQPRVLRTGDGWREELIGRLPEMFFDVRRIALGPDAAAGDDTGGRFHVVTVVHGQGVTVEAANGSRHDLAYAETLVIPASVGRYTVRCWGPSPALLVKSLVR
jgi:mannose-6-phosphate isomerase class I